MQGSLISMTILIKHTLLLACSSWHFSVLPFYLFSHRMLSRKWLMKADDDSFVSYYIFGRAANKSKNKKKKKNLYILIELNAYTICLKSQNLEHVPTFIV